MLSQSISLYKKLQKQYSRRINLNLNRIEKVLKKLNQPHLQVKNPINIIGSDGKMSVLTSLKFFLEANNKKVNTFTSPHLYDLRHRMSLKNKFISISQIKKFKKIIEKTKKKLTLFELLTCIYLLAAKEQKNVDFNLIESGLLFKKDSTNLWNKPRAQIITNINFQHQEWVKPKTIGEICRQKVGFLSKNTVIYIGEQNLKNLKIIKKILKKNPSKKIYFSNWKILFRKKKYFYKDKKNLIPIETNLINSNALIKNLGLAIKVALDFGVSKKIITKTIPKIQFEGRVQYIKKGKLKNLLKKKEKLLVDGCHSEESAKNLYNYLKELKEPIYGIWGMKKNKYPEKFLKHFNKIFKEMITITIPDEPNALKSELLAEVAKKLTYKAHTATSIQNAINKISDNKKKIIVIFGSLYLVGNALSKN